MRLRHAPGLAAALTLLAGSEASAQCALCRDAVAASSLETREAFNFAIIGLAFAPFLVAGIAAWALSPTLRAFLRTRFVGRRVSPAGNES